jgi:hypothetical protein
MRKALGWGALLLGLGVLTGFIGGLLRPNKRLW